MANLVQLGILERTHGFIAVDKPAGIPFSTVVKTVRRKFNLPKLGHGGSIETMASGLMVLLLNDANRYVDNIMAADRAYEGTVRLGLRTDTGDIFGRPVEGAAAAVPPLADFKGDVFIAEPRYAAVKREGGAQYEVVDTGEHERFMTHVYRLEFTGNAFTLSSTRNMIVRALVDEMGLALETLRRTKVGRFDVASAVPFEKILEFDAGELVSCVTGLRDALL